MRASPASRPSCNPRMQSCTRLLSQYTSRIATPALLAARRRAAASSASALAPSSAMATNASAPLAGALEQDEAGRRPAPTEPLLSIAPMLDVTDVHFRQLARLITRRTWLWTEMVVDKTLVYAPHQRRRHLAFPPEQRPLVLQLGGSDPQYLRQAARIAAPYGYDEVNLNCGCPSDRVAGAGCFGAALMLDAKRVAACAAAIGEGLAEGCAAAAAEAAAAAAGQASNTTTTTPSTAPPSPPPVSIKCRLGVDDADTYAALKEFVRVVSAPADEGGGGVSHFVIHARKCLLNGLSPAQNRSVPPLRHEWLWALKRDFPNLRFTLNGGVASGRHAAAALAAREHGLGRRVPHGVMIGRAAASDPWGCLAGADELVFGDPASVQEGGRRGLTRKEVVDAYCAYADGVIETAREEEQRRKREEDERQQREAGAAAATAPEQQEAESGPEKPEQQQPETAAAGQQQQQPSGAQVYVPTVRHMARPLLGLFHGAKGGRRWRAALEEEMREKGKHPTVRSLMDATLPFLPPEELEREAPTYAGQGQADAALEQGRREAEAAAAAEAAGGEENSSSDGALPLWWEWTGGEEEEGEGQEQEQEEEAMAAEAQQQQQEADAAAAPAERRDQQPPPQPPRRHQPLLPPYRLGALPGPTDRAAGDTEAAQLRAKDARRAARRQQRRQQRDAVKQSVKRAAKEAAAGSAAGGGSGGGAAAVAVAERPSSS